MTQSSRQEIIFFLNGQKHIIDASLAHLSLSEYLRKNLFKTGTKVVCTEGDCGACSVLIANLKSKNSEYIVVNSCIYFLYQIDLCHIITIEGLKLGNELNCIQEAMINCHGTQCGYCTPGFIVAMCGFYNNTKSTCKQELKDALTGNLCRCTGYDSIIKAGTTINDTFHNKLEKYYPLEQLQEQIIEFKETSVLLNSLDQTIFIPRTESQAANFKKENPNCTIVAGGTDIGVLVNKRNFKAESILCLNSVENFDQIEIQEAQEIQKDSSSENKELSIGASVTLSKLSKEIKNFAPEFEQILWIFGSPQIRNVATLAGNIANASPIGDTIPFLMVMDANLELTSGTTKRIQRINEYFLAYKQVDMRSDELISRIIIPLPKKDEFIRLYKVSRRKHLDISTITAAFRVTYVAGIVENISIAYGGVAPIVLRLKEAESFLQGKKLSLECLDEAAKIACSEISPIDDVRGSSDFRFTLAKNLFYKFYYELSEKVNSKCLV